MTQAHNDIFNGQRERLFGIAYRMLGSVMDAEDVVQEAFLRWQQADLTQVRSPQAYLTTIVSRLSIDQLRAAQQQREVYMGPWLPEPLRTEAQPEEAIELAETLAVGFLVMLERLSPVERAVYLLREVFEYDYDEIAAIVQRSQANCRQLVHRAKGHLAQRPRFDVQPAEQERILAAFVGAVASGDMDGLTAVLAQDVALWSDGGGKVRSATRPLVGVTVVTRFLLGLAQQAAEGLRVEYMTINGQQALAVYRDGQLDFVAAADFAAGRITALHLMRNPDKLRHLQ